MDHTDAVGGVQTAADLLRDLDRLFRRELLFLLDQAAQIMAFHELHGDELQAIGVAQVVDPNDILVSDLMGEYQFLLETIENGGVSRQFRSNHFERDHAIHFAIPRPVNRAHAPFAEKLENLVASPEYGADLQ